MTAEEQPPKETPEGGFMGFLKAVATSDAFEEAKLAFYVTIVASFLALFTCHWLKEISSLASLLTGMWTGFGVLIGKIGWGKNQ